MVGLGNALSTLCEAESCYRVHIPNQCYVVGTLAVGGLLVTCESPGSKIGQYLRLVACSLRHLSLVGAPGRWHQTMTQPRDFDRSMSDTAFDNENAAKIVTVGLNGKESGSLAPYGRRRS
jgi:hypothetical protein